MNPEFHSNKNTLGDDGELHQILDDPSTRRDAIFCIHCTAPNLPGAKFCNECGRSLTEQQIESALSDDTEWAKAKNDEEPRPRLPTYDPDRYTLREKLPVWRPLLALIVGGLIMANAMFPDVFAAITRVANAHPTEAMVAIIIVILAAIALWFSSIKD